MHRNLKRILELFLLVCILELLNANLVSVGTSKSFTCLVNQPTEIHRIYWEIKEENQGKRTLFLCDKLDVPNCIPISNQYIELFEATSDLQSLTFTSDFKIKSVKPSDSRTEWFCVSDSGSGPHYNTSYSLLVYANPTTPKCENIALLNDYLIQIKCVTEKVFPTARCVFYFITNNTKEFELKNGSIIYKGGSSSIPDYNTTECTYTGSAGLIGPGSHVVFVVMYPDIASNITNTMKEKSHLTATIQIGYPKATLEHNCQFNRYVKENETINCTCHDGNINFLPSRINWFGGESSSETLMFIARRPSEGNLTFRCIVSNSLNWTSQINYQPNVSYPASLRTITLNSTNKDLCDDQHENIEGSCSIAGSNPEPNVYIAFNKSMYQLKQEKEKNEYTFNIAVSSTGIFNVTCYANNSEFRHFSGGVSRFFTIKGPPSSPKIIRLENKELSQPSESMMQVTEKETTVLCLSTGGYPIAKNISLHCGQWKNQTTDESVYLTINITKAIKNISCTCVVLHESKCFENNATLEFKFSDDDTENTFGSKDGTESNIPAIAAGSSTGILIIIFFVLIGVIKKRFDHLSSTNSFEKETTVNNSDLYFLEKEISLHNMNLPEYFNVETSMRSATEVPKNFKN